MAAVEGFARMMPAPQRRPHCLRWLVMLALAALLGACGEAHVVQRERGYDARNTSTSTHAMPATRRAGSGEVEVIRGDTLYGLAFRNGMDFRELAAINGVEAPYTIYVGQILKLRGDHIHASIPIRPAAQAPPHPARIMPQPATVPGRRPRVAPEPVASAPNMAAVPAHTSQQSVPTPFEPVPSGPMPQDAASSASAPSAQTPPTAIQPAPMPHAPTTSVPMRTNPIPTAPSQHVLSTPIAAQTPSAAILPAVIAPVGGVGWRWPAKGTLLDHFMAGDATRQGIDIGGNAGDPVFAASDGVVVYSGSGLVGYGELIIIKHSDEWLSAYGHNRKRLVQEGQRVKGGQPIAEMGRSGAPRDMLHFEIRRNGRPVDPQQYLPPR
jgi:lipoprotein NlpD